MQKQGRLPQVQKTLVEQGAPKLLTKDSKQKV